MLKKIKIDKMILKTISNIAEETVSQGFDTPLDVDVGISTEIVRVAAKNAFNEGYEGITLVDDEDNPLIDVRVKRKGGN